MTEAAIRSLSQNEQGFYLNIEGGRVDHANHDGNVKSALVDGKAFQDAIAKAAEVPEAAVRRRRGTGRRPRRA